MDEIDRSELRQAKRLLENPGFAAKLTSWVGTPIEKGFELLPANWQSSIRSATEKALLTALRYAVQTLKDRPGASPSNWLHRVGVVMTGGAAGLAGMMALPVELPISTTIMMRSVADVARSQGEDIRSPEGQVACIEVFALGGRSRSDDAAESGYFAVRLALARAVSEAVEFIAARGVVEEGAPILLRLIAGIAARFSVQVSEKAAAQIVPVIGAAGGALVNYLFIDHFQDMARGHFTVRRLERKYGAERVRDAYSKAEE